LISRISLDFMIVYCLIKTKMKVQLRMLVMPTDFQNRVYDAVKRMPPGCVL